MNLCVRDGEKLSNEFLMDSLSVATYVLIVWNLRDPIPRYEGLEMSMGLDPWLSERPNPKVLGMETSV